MKDNPTRDLLAEMFLESLSEEKLPWHMPWVSDGVNLGQHLNVVSGKPYRGVNAVMTWAMGMKKGYDDHRWCTYKQAKDSEWQVRKGEKATPVEYWFVYDNKQKKVISFSECNEIIKKDRDRVNDMQPRFNTYYVFNGSQIDGIPELEKAKQEKLSLTDQMLKKFLKSYTKNAGVGLERHDSRAFYRSSEDKIYLPPSENFDTEQGYYLTALHECAHSTGHESRLNRQLDNGFGTENYAVEELRAEIASTFILSACGVKIPDEILSNNKAYIQSWISDIKEKPSVLFAAIKDAEGISDYVCDKGKLQTLLLSQQKIKENVGIEI